MTSDAPPPPVAPVDEVLPAKELATFGLQHVLGMYAGAVAVPLIVGAAFKVSAADMAVLIAADIFTAGIATALTCVGIWKIGARLPIMQGCTFAAVGPIVAAAGQGHPITDVFGAIIIAGIIAVLLAPVMGKLRRFFPPLVVGTVILLIGISLLPVAVDWAGDVFSQDPNNSVPNNLAMTGPIAGRRRRVMGRARASLWSGPASGCWVRAAAGRSAWVCGAWCAFTTCCHRTLQRESTACSLASTTSSAPTHILRTRWSATATPRT